MDKCKKFAQWVEDRDFLEGLNVNPVEKLTQKIIDKAQAGKTSTKAVTKDAEEEITASMNALQSGTDLSPEEKAKQALKNAELLDTVHGKATAKDQAMNPALAQKKNASLQKGMKK